MTDWGFEHGICGLEELPARAGPGVTHLLSILDPEWPEPEALTALPPERRHLSRFHDIIEPAPGMILPEREHVEALLAFGRSLAGGDPAHLLVHCHAGVSRSTAATAALLLQAHPGTDDVDVLRHIVRIRKQAWPNSRMIAFADEILGREGRLVAALPRLYRHQLRLMPDFAGELRAGGRGAEVEMGL